MSELTKERRELRERLRVKRANHIMSVTMHINELEALLDALDAMERERDALEQMNHRQVEMVRNAEKREERAKADAVASVRKARRQRDEAQAQVAQLQAERDEARRLAEDHRATLFQRRPELRHMGAFCVPAIPSRLPWEDV